MKHNQDWTLEALTVIRGWLPFPPHSGLHSALPPGSPGKTALAAGRTTCRRRTTLQSRCRFHSTVASPARLSLCLPHDELENKTLGQMGKRRMRRGLSAYWQRGCGLAGCITRRSRDTAGRLSPPWTRHISINLLIWQHGPRVNQNSRLLCHKCIFQVYGPIWHP